MSRASTGPREPEEDGVVTAVGAVVAGEPSAVLVDGGGDEVPPESGKKMVPQSGRVSRTLTRKDITQPTQRIRKYDPAMDMLVVLRKGTVDMMNSESAMSSVR